MGINGFRCLRGGLRSQLLYLEAALVSSGLCICVIPVVMDEICEPIVLDTSRIIWGPGLSRVAEDSTQQGVCAVRS